MSLQLRSGLMLAIGVGLGFIAARSGNPIAASHADRQTSAAAALLPTHVLNEVLERVRGEYVDRIDDQRLVDAAINGILEELDPHSTYLNPDQYEEVRISTSGNYTGVGLDVSVDDGRVTVVAPLDGAPAARAGILPGDVVVSVDDLPVSQDNVDDAVNRMRGAIGTEVMVGVMREGSEQPLRFALTRAEVQVNTVRAEYLGDGVGYLRLSAFSEHTSADLASAARSLHKQSGTGLKGVVLDLRNNPGGVLNAAVEVADSFLHEGLIVRGSGRARRSRFEQHAHAGDELEGVPTIVLVNGGSASASEIVAGALQDHRRARIVGERTYGKGSVQTVMPLGEGSAIKLTTSRYMTPSGRSINGVGIEPDVVVRIGDAKRQYRGPAGASSIADDPQLLEALRLISYDAITVSAAP